jgi:hypothetical protein
LRAGLNRGDWAASRGDWGQAQEAYGSARVAAERLLGQHVDRRDVEAWLSAAGVSAALARARLATLAATHPELAARFRQAAARLNTQDRHSRASLPPAG